MALLLTMGCAGCRQDFLGHGRGDRLPSTPLFTTVQHYTGINIMSKKSPPKPPETSLKGRDAKTGLFIPVSTARQHPSTTVVERVPLPGKGRK